MKLAFGLLKLSVALVCLWLALDWRAPALANVRPWALAALIGLPLAITFAELWLLKTWRTQPRIVMGLSTGTLIIALAAGGITAGIEAQFHWKRSQVLAADADQLERL